MKKMFFQVSLLSAGMADLGGFMKKVQDFTEEGMAATLDIDSRIERYNMRPVVRTVITTYIQLDGQDENLLRADLNSLLIRDNPGVIIV